MRRLLLLALPLLLAACPGGGELPTPSVSIRPAAPDVDDDLLLVVGPLGEGETRPGLSWVILWRKDGATLGDLDGLREVPAERTEAGETWQVTVFVQRGGELGPPAEAVVEIRGDDDPDDDDVAPDDDDSAPDDDDSAPDDDDDAPDDDDIAPDDDDAAAPCGPDPQTPLLAAFGHTLVCLEPDAFTMGSPTTEADRGVDELEHTVELTGHLLVGAVEISADLYDEVVAQEPSDCSVGCDPDDPVQLVSWLDAVAFCNELSTLEGLAPVYDLSGDQPLWDDDLDGYRLLTEAEWEYAARADGSGPYAGSSVLQDVAFCGVWETEAIGSLAANDFGLFDMSGNVSEWVWDRYGPYPLTGPDAPDVDPDGPAEGDTRVHRGGSWRGPGPACRVADRDHAGPDLADHSIGFRIARTVQ